MSTVLALGGMATKWVLRLWLKDSSLSDVAGDLSDLVRVNLDDEMEGRRASRQLEQVAELMAERIGPYLEHEFAGEPVHEREAAVAAVSDTLAAALAQSLNPIALDLDATLIEEYVRLCRPDAAAIAALSAGGEAFYNLVLTECCAYIAATCAKLPDFQSAAARELLARNTALLNLGEEVLARLPRAMPDSWGAGSEDEIFASKYLKAVVQRNDSIQLFGVRDGQYRSTYSLSVAYISLSATIPMSEAGGIPIARPSSGAPRPTGDAGGKHAAGSDNEADEALRVETALSGHPRIVLGGQAGSGKTTLIQWLAVTASQAGFQGELEEWNGCIPYVLQLRRFANGELPKPEEFVGVNHPALSGIMPQGWVHRTLAAGRGIVLVDGLDELPEDQRAEAYRWLTELVDTFPDSRFLVTSRPLAISESWSSIPNFKYSELLSMGRSDIRAFVRHWHSAAAKLATDEEGRESLLEAERHLLFAISELPAIRLLCTSPLLCALVCAMHRQNVNKLPQNRMELYDTALQMLVSSRDEDRKIAVPEAYRLTYPENKALLADFALWLHESGASDAEMELYERRIAEKSRTLPRRSDLDGKLLSDRLLKRSGVLRVPVEGRVDFVHRTFLEYLAAAQLADDEAVDKVIDHAELDQWREVVIMTAGHLKQVRREELIRGLVARGRADERVRHRLYLLAVACLETSPVLSSGTQLLLSQCLDEVVPPESMTDAAAVASAGALAVPRLSNPRVLAKTAAACIRALSIIGTDEAMEALAVFAPDRRVTVARQLIRAWNQFDPETFAREVLAKSPLDGGHVVIRDPECFEHAHYLEHAESIFLDLGGKMATLTELPPSDVVTGISLSRANGMVSLSGIGRFPYLGWLGVDDSRSLRSLAGLASCKHLKVADFARSAGLVDIEDLAAFTSLDFVDLYSTDVHSLDALDGVAVRDLRIGGLSLRGLTSDLRAESLTVWFAPRLVDYSPLATCEQLKNLTIQIHDSGEDLTVIPLPPSLASLHISSPMNRAPKIAIEGGLGVKAVRTSWPTLDILPLMSGVETLEVALSSYGSQEASFAKISDSIVQFPSCRTLVLHGRGSEQFANVSFRLVSTAGRPPYRSVYERA